jgi:hypothetical protein
MADFVTTAATLLAEARTAREADDADALQQALRNLHFQYEERMKDAVLQGCTFPNRPVELEAEAVSLLNFGTSPDLLRRDLALRLCKEQKRPAPGDGQVVLPPTLKEAHASLLQKLLPGYGETHGRTRVYNLEPWIQCLYRDRLDIEYGDYLRRRIETLQTQMNAVPMGLMSIGLTRELAEEVMAAFRDFRGVVGSSHALEKDKSSFTGRRAFTETMSGIEDTIRRAEDALAMPGNRSRIRELFTYWKEASYEIMRLNRTLKTAWTGTVMDERVAELRNLLAALQQTYRRCSGPETPMPCGVLAAEDVQRICPREVIEEAFQSVLMQDIIGRDDPAAERLEARRFGPLTLLILPGTGRARYSSELREAHAARLASGETDEREFDLDRRANYPLNTIVLPSLTPKKDVLERIAEAWLEYKAASRPAAYKNAMEQAAAILPVEATAGGQVRRVFATYLAAFIRFAGRGRRAAAELPQFEAFAVWARKRMPRPGLLVSPRYRGVVEQYAEAPAKRQSEIFERYLGERTALDRQILALHTERKDWGGVRKTARFLFSETRQDRNLQKALEAITQDDQTASSLRKSELFMTRFLTDDPEMKTALLSLESRLNSGVQAYRAKAAKEHGRACAYEEAHGAVSERLLEQLMKEREALESTIDRNLAGMLYFCDANPPAAVTEFTACLEQPACAEDLSDPFDASAVTDEATFKAAFDHGPSSDFAETIRKRYARSVASIGRAVCRDEFVLYNLGQACRKKGDLREAHTCLGRFRDWAKGEGWLLLAGYAESLMQEVVAESQAGAAPGGADGEGGGG